MNKLFFVLILLFLVIYFVFYSNQKSYEKFRFQTKKELIESLYSTNIMYKNNNKFVNTSPQLIALLKDDDRFSMYVNFLLMLNTTRNEKFPSGKNPCHQFINKLYLNVLAILEDAQKNKRSYFSPSTKNLDKLMIKKYFRKKKTMMKLDEILIDLFETNQENKSNSCYIDFYQKI